MPTSSSSSSASSSSSGEIESPFALLEAVERAILAVLNMQSYKLGERTVSYANLAELRQLRKELKREITGLQGTRPYVSMADFRGNF